MEPRAFANTTFWMAQSLYPVADVVNCHITRSISPSGAIQPLRTTLHGANPAFFGPNPTLEVAPVGPPYSNRLALDDGFSPQLPSMLEPIFNGELLQRPLRSVVDYIDLGAIIQVPGELTQELQSAPCFTDPINAARRSPAASARDRIHNAFDYRPSPGPTVES